MFFFLFFFFNDTATTEIYTLSLHDALPISVGLDGLHAERQHLGDVARSEEHTSELQSRSDLVCRLLLEKKKKKKYTITNETTTRKHHDPFTTQATQFSYEPGSPVG